MHLNWKQRLDNDPSLKNVHDWVSVQPSSLPRSKQSKFVRNLKAVTKVANGELIKDVAKELNVSSAAISVLMKKTFAGDSNQPPALTTALIPMARINKDKRRSELSDYHNTKGARCSFNYLLDTVSGLDNYLNEIVKLHVKKAKHGENLTPKSFHNNFLQYLSDQNWPQNKYPFDQFKLGYESCRKYFHKLVAKFSVPKTKYNIVRINPTVNRAYDEVQIDSQTLDINTSAYFEFDGLVSPHRLSRMTLFIAIDVATDCVLAYKLCFSDSPTQYDLLDLLISINKKWKPRKLKTPGLTYEPGACLPSSLGSTYQNAGIGTISLDNALCHHSHTVREYICNEMAATIKLGLPAHPKTRNVVEYAFNRLNRYIHRFSCTTGSHPKDALKESLNNAKKPPVLTVNVLEDILSVILTHHNNTSQNRLVGHSPLSMIKSQMSNRLIRINHHMSASPKNPFIREHKVKVCWSSKEKRIPYIHFQGLRYSAPNVLDSSLIKKEIIIKYDYRDIRKLEAVTIKGEKIGVLNAPLSWQRYKHSVDTRKYIMNLIKQKKISGKDPLHRVFEYLYKNREFPSEALSLANLITEFTEEQTEQLPANDMTYSFSRPRKLISQNKFKWKANIVKKRESK